MSWLSQWLSRVDVVQFISGGALGGIVGGVLGGGATVFVNYLVPKWRQPKLRIEPQLVPDISARSQSGEAGVQFYVRIKIRNDGRSIAKNVRCMVDSIGSPADVNALNKEEVIDLPFALGEGLRSDIPSETHRFVDLCHTWQAGQKPVEFQLDARAVPSRFSPMLRLQGQFVFHVIAVADNAPTVSDLVRVRWRGGVDQLSFE